LEPKARDLFKDGRPLDDAVLYTQEPYELYRKAIIDSISSLQEAQKNFHHVSEPKETDFANITELSKIADDLKGLVELKLSKSKKKVS
jgi:hypothetical protein